MPHPPAVEALIDAGERLIAEKKAAAKAHEVALLAVLADPSLLGQSARGGGWAPIHAARLLVERRSRAAIGPMIDHLLERDPIEILHETVKSGLEEVGGLALEACLERHATLGEEARRQIEDVLAGLGVRDERIERILLDALPLDAGRAAGNLARYGWEGALDALRASLETQSLDEAGRQHALVENHHIFELAHAIRALGGALSSREQAKLDAALAQRQSSIEAQAARTGPRPKIAAQKIGRNEPCWCGSGKKFKKCHGRPR